MIAVIIAGGSGTRLWPLSLRDYPKHLLSLTNNKSLLQNTVDRAKLFTKKDKIFVISETSHIKHVYSQLKDIDKSNILVEPTKKGTAGCLLLMLKEIKKHNLPHNEPIIVMYADHLVKDNEGFVATALRAGELSKEEKELVFIGVEPSKPATGFGYMQKGAAVSGWYNVFELAGFKEKPNKKTAEKFFNSGKYLWNIGCMVGSLNILESAIKNQAPKLWNSYINIISTKEIKTYYATLPIESIENSFSENINKAYIMPGSFDWVDVGSFSDLHSVSKQNRAGNYVKGKNVVLEKTANSFVRNETNIPLAVIGLDNVVVVTTKDGYLVTNKNYSQLVGEVANKIQK